MFTVGDAVVYVHHGAGVVRAVETIERDGRATEYLSVEILKTGMTALIPAESGRGLRPVSSPAQLKKVITTLRGEPAAGPARWNQRFKKNQERLATGDVLEVAGVVRDLAAQESISPAERQMLEGARAALAGELQLARGISEDEACALIDEAAGGVHLTRS